MILCKYLKSKEVLKSEFSVCCVMHVFTYMAVVSYRVQENDNTSENFDLYKRVLIHLNGIAQIH